VKSGKWKVESTKWKVKSDTYKDRCKESEENKARRKRKMNKSWNVRTKKTDIYEI